MGGAFEVTVASGDATVTMNVSGELDLASAPELRDTCARVLERDPELVRMDLSGLTFLDSSGISVLVQLQQDLERRDAKLVLHRVGDRVARVLEIAGLDSFFARSDQPVE